MTADAARRTRAVPASETHMMGLVTRFRRTDAGPGHRTSWSRARLSAAIAATRSGRARVAADQPLGDEIEFFASIGTRHDVPTGAALVRRGRPMGEVHLVQRGAVAVIGDHRGRRPILAFAAPSEFCCAVPALLQEPAPWDAVTVIGSSVITVPAATFTAAVRDRWVDRWSTRTLSWLAEVGVRVADLDGGDIDGQVAALLLRHRSEWSVDLCRRTIADLLDVDEEIIRQVLADLERLGAVRFAGGRVSVAQPEVLQASVAAGRRLPEWTRQRASDARHC
jgi:CRP-like cAMP-binding protein